jgi:hypothetical protein
MNVKALEGNAPEPLKPSREESSQEFEHHRLPNAVWTVDDGDPLIKVKVDSVVVQAEEFLDLDGAYAHDFLRLH